MSEAKRRALALADNKIAENAAWDRELLATELSELTELLMVEDFDISITGFAQVDRWLQAMYVAWALLRTGRRT